MYKKLINAFNTMLSFWQMLLEQSKKASEESSRSHAIVAMPQELVQNGVPEAGYTWGGSSSLKALHVLEDHIPLHQT